MNFGNTIAEIQQKYEREREREKVGERECMNFGNVITQIPVARSVCLSMCAVCLKWDMLKKKNQLWQYHCRNRDEIFFFVAIMAMHSRNRGRKKKIVVTEIWGGIKKISATSIIFL